MNVARRLLTAVTAGVLGAGAGAFVACRQEPAPDARSGSAGSERRAPDAKYDDGYYDFYFKNDAHTGGDCDGYSSGPDGKTTIYEYFQCDINDWERRLAWVGIGTEVYRTSKPKHCWARFDTNLLSGIGWEGRGFNIVSDDEADILANRTRLNFKDLRGLHYAQAHGNFTSPYSGKWYNSLIRIASEVQKERDAPAILFVFHNYDGRYTCVKSINALTAAGVSVIEKGTADENPYIIADASNIDWFAYSE